MHDAEILRLIESERKIDEAHFSRVDDAITRVNTRLTLLESPHNVKENAERWLLYALCIASGVGGSEAIKFLGG